MPALMKIRSAYSSLPSAERKVADFILNDPKQASLMVINDIARASNVSVPSVTRLARKLGYDGFMEFRVALAAGRNRPDYHGDRATERIRFRRSGNRKDVFYPQCAASKTP